MIHALVILLKSTNQGNDDTEKNAKIINYRCRTSLTHVELSVDKSVERKMLQSVG